MVARYVSPTGSAVGSGSLTDPLALTTALLIVGGEYDLLPGRYTAVDAGSLTRPIVLRATEYGQSIIEPAGQGLVWLESGVGSGVWSVASAAAVRQAVFFDSTGQTGRIPVWTPGGPGLRTVAEWIATVRAQVAGPSWGMCWFAGVLYLIPAPLWGGLGSVRIATTTALAAFASGGPGFQMHGLTLLGHGIGARLSGAASEAVIADCTFRHCGAGIMDVGVLPATYGNGHATVRCRFEDDIPFSWYAVKSTIRSAESVGYYTQGGSSNSTVSDCVFDGTFDGVSQYHEDNRYDQRANTNLRILHSRFRRIRDDAIDLSRWNHSVTFEDCDFQDVGVVISPAPLWGGTITLRRCTGSGIGEQIRVKDAAGKRPPGSVIKCGQVVAGRPPGTVRLERCDFWTATPTTQGISQDGGTGAATCRIEIVDSAIRVPGIVVNWPYPMTGLLIDRSRLACAGSRPLKPATLPVQLVSAAVLDVPRRYMLQNAISDLEAQLNEVPV